MKTGFPTLLKNLYTRRMVTLLGFVLVFMLLPAGSTQAQDFERIRAELRDRQTRTNQEILSLQQLILTYERQIRESTNQYESLYREFQALEREIALRDAVIRGLQQRGAQISEEITLLQRESNQNRAELERLITTYKESLRYLYKHGRVPEMAYLLTSGSFNQMLVRSYYLRRFEDQRSRQAEGIRIKQEELKRKEEELVAAREDVRKNLNDTRDARTAMDETRRRQNQTITQLQQDRRQTQEKLADSRRAVENLNQVLNNTIVELERVQREEEARIRALEAERLRRLAEAQQIQNAELRAREVARYSEPVASASMLPSAEAMASLERSFVGSKGRLDWPVPNGVITQNFGFRVHPVYRTQIPSPGIEVSTESRSPVLAVHDGYVSAILRGLQEYGDVIIISHGSTYRTVYGNMSEINVTQHMFVRAGDIIGRSGVETSPRGTSVFFMIRQGADRNLDPSEWIQARQTRTPQISR
jgi:murein hydrolase activator